MHIFLMDRALGEFARDLNISMKYLTVSSYFGYGTLRDWILSRNFRELSLYQTLTMLDRTRLNLLRHLCKSETSLNRSLPLNRLIVACSKNKLLLKEGSVALTKPWLVFCFSRWLWAEVRDCLSRRIWKYWSILERQGKFPSFRSGAEAPSSYRNERGDPDGPSSSALSSLLCLGFGDERAPIILGCNTPHYPSNYLCHMIWPVQSHDWAQEADVDKSVQ